MSNPVYLLKPAAYLSDAAAREAGRQSSVFTPSVIQVDELYEAIESEAEAYKKVDLPRIGLLYMGAVLNLRSAEAYNHLSTLFLYKSYMVKVLLEAAMYLVGEIEMRITNRIFEEASETMSALQAVLCTKLLLNTAKYSTFYKVVNDPNIREVESLDLVLDRTIFKLPATKKRQSLELKMLPSYKKLEYCSRKYWSFPLFLETLQIPKVIQQLRQLAKLPREEPSDTKIAREMKELEEAYFQ